MESVKPYIYDFTDELPEKRSFKFNPSIAFYKENKYLCCYRIFGRNRIDNVVDLPVDLFSKDVLTDREIINSATNHPWLRGPKGRYWWKSKSYDEDEQKYNEQYKGADVTKFAFLEINDSDVTVKPINKMRDVHRRGSGEGSGEEYVNGYVNFVKGVDMRLLKVGKNTFIATYNTWASGKDGKYKAKISYRFIKIDPTTYQVTVYPQGELCDDFQDFEKNWSLFMYDEYLFITYGLDYNVPPKINGIKDYRSTTIVVVRHENSKLRCRDNSIHVVDLKQKFKSYKYDLDGSEHIHISTSTPGIFFNTYRSNRFIAVGHLKFQWENEQLYSNKNKNTWIYKFREKYIDKYNINNHPIFIYLCFFYSFVIDSTGFIEYDKFGKLFLVGDSVTSLSFPSGLTNTNDNNEFILSYGDFDTSCKFVKFKKEHIKKLLLPQRLDEEITMLQSPYENVEFCDKELLTENIFCGED